VGFRLIRCGNWRVERAAGPYARLREAGLQAFSRILDEGILGRRPELAGILKAMMLGRQSELSPEQKQRYMLSGTMHLFAISGLHIAVIAAALGGLIAWLPLGGWGRFLFSASLLWFYVDVTGAAPSALRSYLMVICVQLAWLGRLPGSSLSGLCLATAWVLVLSPLDFFSAGFQMSYGIVAALILYGQPLTEFLLERFDPFAPVPEILRGPGQRTLELLRVWALPTAALSLSAGLVSLLSGIAFFGTLSHGSVLANLLMIPASVLVIHAGFVALVLGLTGWAAAAALFNYAAGLVLWAMDATLAWFVGLPGVYAPLVFRQAWLGGAGLGMFLLLLLACYELRWGRRGGLLWLPPLAATAFVVLAAVFPS
jgi:competence protein ComEC